MEERFDDSSKQSGTQAAVKWMAFLAKTGAGRSGVDRAKKAKIFFAIDIRAGRHQAVFSFLRKDMSASASAHSRLLYHS